jgi:small subunit ribosomal protein S2
MSQNQTVEQMFAVGAHYGYAKSRRHPTILPYIYGAKGGVEIFDLEKTVTLLDKAKEFAKQLGSEDKQILFVAGKRQALSALKAGADSINQPYVIGRWIGGTLTNFEEISKRVQRLETLLDQKEKGLLAKYTKKERLLIDREIEKLELRFGGIVSMKRKPAAMFIIDASQEHIAHAEAIVTHVPVISLCGSDCNIQNVEYPIVANDSSIDSIKYFISEIVEAYKEGQKNKKVETAAKKD